MPSLGTRLAALAGRRSDDAWPAVPPARGGWTWSALRSAGLLLALGAVVVGWWWWTGRPAPAVPVVMASGSPLPSAASPDAVEPGRPSAPGPGESGPPVSTATPAALPEDAPASTPPTIVVHVIGMVRHPGLVTLPAGARVADAVAAAGGVTRPRSADTVNLARPVLDGEQIVVGLPGTPARSTPAAPGAPATAGAAPGASMPAAVPVDLNAAAVAALDELPGIGPVLAGRIVEWRTAHGPFRSVDELGEVVGIGPALVERLRPHVRV